MIAAPEIKVRTRLMKEFGQDVPDEARVLFDLAAKQGWSQMSFAVPAMPPTINHAYTQVSRERRVLSAETVTFRQMTNLAIGNQRHTWKPIGRVMVMVFLLSPYWLTKKRTVREADLDNKLKMLLDAIQLTTGVKDETNWELHAWKICTVQRVQTCVWLFDQGDLVEVYA